MVAYNLRISAKTLTTTIGESVMTDVYYQENDNSTTFISANPFGDDALDVLRDQGKSTCLKAEAKHIVRDLRSCGYFVTKKRG